MRVLLTSTSIPPKRSSAASTSRSAAAGKPASPATTATRSPVGSSSRRAASSTSRRRLDSTTDAPSSSRRAAAALPIPPPPPVMIATLFSNSGIAVLRSRFHGNYCSGGDHIIKVVSGQTNFRYHAGMTPRVPEPHLSAWRSVLNAHASVVARAEEALAQADLPPLAWYDVLWAVRRAPGRRIRMADLASGLTLSRGGLTKLADRLEAAELLRRERAEDDGRGLYAVLTAAGEQMLRRMWPVYAGVLRRTFVDAMTAAEAAAVAHALDRSNRA